MSPATIRATTGITLVQNHLLFVSVLVCGGAILAIERDNNGRPATDRVARRHADVAPLVAELDHWMRAERVRVSRHAEIAKAIDYMLKRWAAFTRFLDDGRICLSNNAAERALRGVAIGRKARLFAGSDRGGERAAAMYSLITAPSSTTSTRSPVSPTCCAGSTIAWPRGSTNCFPGSGKLALPRSRPCSQH
jgi:hypothetical protein